MLISDFHISIQAKDYARFISALSWFRMYCACNLGATRDDYISGFNNLKHYHDELFYYEEEEPVWVKNSTGTLLKEIQNLLAKKHLNDENLTEISNLIYVFEQNGLLDFERNCFEYQRSKIIEEVYPKKLYNATYDLMKHNQYESAVLAAFKFLDSHLQTLLSVDANHYFGEDLVNQAFSPNSGVLQFQGHPNEQIGIRNFFSGANAVFRNPSAHRFVKYDMSTAEAIIAMVAMMANVATRIKDGMNSSKSDGTLKTNEQ